MTSNLASRSDQAEGLRQMFARSRTRFVPVVSNPHIAFGGVLLERLCTAFSERGVKTLVVDAAERAGSAGELAMVDIGQCIETLSPRVSYLAARDLPLRFVDTSGSTRGFLQAVSEAAHCDVVLVHASASELCRMFSQKRVGAAWVEAPCPILLAEDQPDSVTHAYAAMKMLARRAGLVVFDLVLGTAPHSPRAERIAAQLASCADDFFGAVVRLSALVDPAGKATEPANAALRRLIDQRLDTERAANPSQSRAFGARTSLAFS